LDFGGTVTDFCLPGLPTIVYDEPPPPASVDVESLINFVRDAPILHRMAFQKWGGQRNT
jgi:hypothetical protein